MEARKAVLNIREGRPPCTAPPPHVGGYFPFIGRLKECQHLRELHARRKCALIRGPAGIGKSELVAHLRQELELLICPRTTRFGEICESFEPELRLSGEGLRLLPRKKQLRQALRSCGRTVVFDGVGWTTPKLSSFLESVAERTPVWICARSEHPWDIGHIWPLLVRFERVELRPFHP